jgi:AcrR family transcriptional regulator
VNADLETRVLAAAIAVIARRGFSRATVNAIAAGAKMTSAAISRSFGRRDHLLEEALRRAIDNVLDPQGSLQSMADTLQLGRTLPLIRKWSYDALERDSGSAVMQALASRQSPWRRIALDALRKAFAKADSARDRAASEHSAETHLRVIEFSDFRRR